MQAADSRRGDGRRRPPASACPRRPDGRRTAAAAGAGGRSRTAGERDRRCSTVSLFAADIGGAVGGVGEHVSENAEQRPVRWKALIPRAEPLRVHRRVQVAADVGQVTVDLLPVARDEPSSRSAASNSARAAWIRGAVRRPANGIRSRTSTRGWPACEPRSRPGRCPASPVRCGANGPPGSARGRGPAGHRGRCGRSVPPSWPRPTVPWAGTGRAHRAPPVAGLIRRIALARAGLSCGGGDVGRIEAGDQLRELGEQLRPTVQQFECAEIAGAGTRVVAVPVERRDEPGRRPRAFLGGRPVGRHVAICSSAASMTRPAGTSAEWIAPSTKTSGSRASSGPPSNPGWAQMSVANELRHHGRLQPGCLAVGQDRAEQHERQVLAELATGSGSRQPTASAGTGAWGSAGRRRGPVGGGSANDGRTVAGRAGTSAKCRSTNSTAWSGSKSPATVSTALDGG